jgi:hypothetical protein
LKVKKDMGCGNSRGVHAAQGLSTPEGMRRYEAAQLKMKQKEADDFQKKFGFTQKVQIPGQMPMMGMQQPMMGMPGQMPMMGMQQPMMGMPGQMPMMGMQQPMMGMPGQMPMMGMQQPITPGQQPYMTPDAYQPKIVEVVVIEQVNYEQEVQKQPKEEPQEVQKQPKEEPQEVQKQPKEEQQYEF